MKLYKIRNQACTLGGLTVRVGLDSKAERLTASIFRTAADAAILPSFLTGADRESIVGPRGDTLVKYGQHTFDFAELRTRRGHSDRQAWVVFVDPLRITELVPSVAQYQESAAARLTAGEYARSKRANIPVSFNFPFADSTFDECFAIVDSGRSNVDVIYEGDAFDEVAGSADKYPDGPAVRAVEFPTLSISSQSMIVSKRAPTDIHVSVVPGLAPTHELDVWFETVNGSVSHDRKRTAGGAATVRVYADRLDVGDTVRLKVGTKYWSGLADIELTVVE